MRISVKEIAELVGGEIFGAPDTMITGISGIKEARQGDITFLANVKYASLADKTCASAVITARDAAYSGKPLIKTDNPSLAFVRVANLFFPQNPGHPKGISSLAFISPKAKIGKNINIGPFAIIEDEAVIGDGAIIYGNVYIGCGARIGKNSLVYPHASIREKIEIGERVIIHCGAVIGSDGFGFVAVSGIHEKIPQTGTVVIEDDVEIGANVTIDRARFDKTVIGKGTKIDNLVQIAHNVVIGKNCIIVAQAGISGCTVVGDGATIAGQAGIVGHITIGDNAIVAAQAGVTKPVAANTMVSGYPAREHSQAMKAYACVQGLPGLYKKIKELQDKVNELEARLNRPKPQRKRI